MIGIVFFLLECSFVVSAVVITPSTQFLVGNETYTVNSTMVFDQISIDDTSIVFNETGFYVSSPNSITITLVYIDDDFAGALNGEKVLDFYADTDSGTVVFSLSGFTVNAEYLVKRDGIDLVSCTANLSGFISFSNAVWSVKRFQIYQETGGSGDSTAPELSDIVRMTADPLDTDPLFGWVNISCTVTDDVEVSTVMLRICNPDESWTNVSMSSGIAGNYYYHSTTAFSPVGNYSYSIKAQDTSGNSITSILMYFSMPPNWDVNDDGSNTVLDLVFISNQYNTTGSPGWIREDVTNDGSINVLDMVYVATYFGLEWWS